MLAGQTKYTTMSGTAELKEAIIAKFKRENNLEYAANEVMVSAGAKQVIFNALMATVEQGCEVIIPGAVLDCLMSRSCNWPEVRPGLSRAARRPASSSMLKALARHITPATRWLVLNSPSNPSGSGLYARGTPSVGGCPAQAPANLGAHR